MARICVIGVGNESRGDDAVGLEVARRLHRLRLPGVTVQEMGGDLSSLLDRWQDADAVILIDASAADAAPGAIVRLEPLTQPIPKGVFPCSTHAFGVVEAIELARALQQLPPYLTVYGIEGKQFNMGGELSAEVLQKIPEIVCRVKDEIIALQAQQRRDCHRA